MNQKPDELAVEQLGYASFIPENERRADPRKMFLYLLPLSIFLSVLVGVGIVESAADGVDTHNFSGAGLIIIFGVLGGMNAKKAIEERNRPGGLKALLKALRWLVPMAVIPLLMLWLCLRCGWFKRF